MPLPKLAADLHLDYCAAQAAACAAASVWLSAKLACFGHCPLLFAVGTRVTAVFCRNLCSPLLWLYSATARPGLIRMRRAPRAGGDA